MKLKNKVTVKNLIKKIIDRRYSISLSNIFNSRRYYIIRRHKPWAGFFANYLFVIEHIIYAKKKGWIPVVDMENYPTLYNEIYPVDGKMNGWEYYFIQPNNVLLEDAYSSRNYIISDTSHYIKYLPYIEGDNEFQILPDKITDIFKNICSIVPLKESIKDMLEMDSSLLRGKVIGVHIRGTDKRLYVKDHRISADLQKYIQATNEIISSFEVDKIFLCCDEEKTVDIFREYYGNKLIVNDAFRAKEGDTEGIHLKLNSERKDHHFLLGYEVLRDCYMLSKCSYLVFSHSNVTNVALIWNNNKYISTKFVENDIYIK